MLGQLETGDRVVIADMEAGVGTIGRMAPESFDRILLVSEPTIKSTEVAKRAKSIIGEAKLGPVLVVANKIRSDDDVAMIQEELETGEVVVVPDDLAVTMADQNGLAPFDSAHGSPAVQAVVKLAERLTDEHAGGDGHRSNGHRSNGSS
ncbi:MAG: hypothetical protein ABR564_08510 [Candidatus Dormibacteria bacterium]